MPISPRRPPVFDPNQPLTEEGLQSLFQHPAPWNTGGGQMPAPPLSVQAPGQLPHQPDVLPLGPGQQRGPTTMTPAMTPQQQQMMQQMMQQQQQAPPQLMGPQQGAPVGNQLPPQAPPDPREAEMRRRAMMQQMPQTQRMYPPPRGGY